MLCWRRGGVLCTSEYFLKVSAGVVVALSSFTAEPCVAQPVVGQPSGPSEAIGVFRRHDRSNDAWLSEVRTAYQRLPTDARVAFADWLGNQTESSDAASIVLIELLRDSWRSARRHAAASLVRLGGGAFPSIARHWSHGPWVNETDRLQAYYLAWVLANTQDDPSEILFPGIFDGVDQPNAVIWDPYEINLSLYVFKQRGARSAAALAPRILSSNVAVSARAMRDCKRSGPSGRIHIERACRRGRCEWRQPFGAPRCNRDAHHL